MVLIVRIRNLSPWSHIIRSITRIGNVETNTFSTTYLKLREVRLDYQLPKSWLKNTFINNASVGIYGRNLLCITSYPMYDPETTSLDGNTFVPGVEVGTLPTSRSWGVNLKVDF